MTAATEVAGLPATGRHPGRTSRRRFARRKGMLGVVLTLPALLLVGGIFVVPIGVSAWMSVSKWPLLGRHHLIGFGNYGRLVGDPAVWRSFGFTAGFAAVITPVVVIVGLLLALLVQERRPGIGIIRTAIFAPVVIGNAAASYLWLALTDPGTGLFGRLLTDLHFATAPPNWLLSTLSATALVAIATLWKTVGFSMIVLMNGLNSVPRDVIEAAKMDGASKMRLLWSVQLPLMTSSIAFVSIFTLIGSLLTFDQFYIITGGGPDSTTISAVYLIYNTAFTQLNLGYASAISIVFMVVIFALTVAQLRLFRAGTR